MNIPHKYLINNGLSEQKKKFYEKLTNNYKRAYAEYKKKNLMNYFHKNVINWLFSQNEETRMILCSVENKKFTNTLHEAYTYYTQCDKEIKFKILDEEKGEEEKFKLETAAIKYNVFESKQKKDEFEENHNFFF